jgi:hypothetical protein
MYYEDSTGAIVGATVSPGQGNPTGMNGGIDLSNWVRDGVPASEAPAGAVSAFVELRKYNTTAGQGDSYAWFCRPMWGDAHSGQTELAGYSPGNGKAVTELLTANVSTASAAAIDAQSKVSTAYWQTSVDAGGGPAFISAQAKDSNGNFTSSVGIGAVDISIYNPSGGNYIKALDVTNGNITIAGDFYGGAGKMVWSNGSVMKVQGTGFGTSNQFIEWFGPNMDISQCWEGNATYYLRTDGTAYFGGAISAGNATTNTKARRS